MKRKIVAAMCALAVLCTSANVFPMSSVSAARKEKAVGTTYYISNRGDNQNSGTSEGEAWQTLDKLKDVKLQPGDSVLFEAGSVFQGFLHLQNVHGTKENPIRIGSYGEGNKPIINARGEGVWYQDYSTPMDNSGHRSKGYVSSAILLYDVDYVEVKGLELTNESDDAQYIQNGLANTSARMDRTGVAGIAKDGGTMDHVYLEDLYIHDIDGNLQDKHMDNGGIQFNVSKPTDESKTGIARYNDVKITNCYVKDVKRAGIVVGYTYQHSKFNGAQIADETVQKYGHTNIYIADNYVQNSGNDAIVAMYAYRPVIERNISDTAGVDLDDGYAGYWQSFCATIWPWKTKDAVFQYNEAFDTVGEGNGDGQAWDIDWSDGTVYQYNYSHNNGGGSMLICLNEAYNGTFRYNLSHNDLGCLITFQGNPEAKIYNNVFYVDGDRATRVHHNASGKRSGSGVISNNIFYNASTANPNDEWEPNGNKKFSNNLYYGYTSTPSTDKHAVVVAESEKDQIFVGPLTAPDSTDGTIHRHDDPEAKTVFDGFKIKEDSAAVNAGVYIPNNGGKDFFGNKLGMTPDIGMHETKAEDGEIVEEIYSDVYKVTENEINDVEVGTTVDEMKENLVYDKRVTLEVYKGEEAAAGDAAVEDGMILKLKNGDTVKEYTIHTVLRLSTLVYEIEGTTIREVPKGTTVGTFKENLIHHKRVNVDVYKGDKKVEDSEVIEEGMTLKVSYKEVSKEFNISLVKVYKEYAATGMTAEAGSFQPNNNTEGNGNLALDNNLNTMWHTNWNGCQRSETWITIDMKKEQNVAMLKYTPRQGGGTNGNITAYEIYVSKDGQTWGEPVATGTWANNNVVKYARFDTVLGRYVKLVATDSASQEASKIFASAAEIRLGFEE